MARKQKKQEAPTLEGWKLIDLYGGEQVHENEEVTFPVTAERAALIADEMKALASTIAEKQRAVAQAKDELRPHEHRHALLVKSLGTGVLHDRRDAWKYISDDGKTVRLVDPSTGETMEEREPYWNEKQEELSEDEQD